MNNKKVAGKIQAVAPVDVATVASIVSPRGGTSRRGYKVTRSGPSTREEITLCDLADMPASHALEVPIKVKRRRMQQPSSAVPGPSSAVRRLPVPGPSSPAPGPTSPAPRPSSPASLSSPPSPATFMDVRSSRHQNLAKDNFLNYGSEDSDEEEASNDVEVGVSLYTSRAFLAWLETPLDDDDDDALHLADAATTMAEVPPTATDRPWSLYDFEWKEFPSVLTPPESRRETFSQINVGPATPSADPYELFTAIWDKQIMENIVSETNRYAQHLATDMMNAGILKPQSRIAQWRDVTVDEIYVYMGLCMAMGVLIYTDMEEYWNSESGVFITPGFKAHMTRNRFELISKCLHFSNNEDMGALELGVSEAKLFKIQPILSHLNNKFQSLYVPSQNLALDESLLPWEGSLSIDQIITNKRVKRGIKTYEICESETGYVWRYEVYTRSVRPRVLEEANTHSTVLGLVRGLEHKGYTLWLNNYYNSPCLARRLKSLGFDCVGTLRTNRQFVPLAVHSLTRQNMHTGQASGLTSGDVDIVVWKDKNRVAFISTYHGNCQESRDGITKPTVLFDYNNMMGSLDKKDQMLAMYPLERRSHCWYKKLFKHLLNISVLNAFIICSRNSPVPVKHRYFRRTLIRDLLAKHAPNCVVDNKTIQNRSNRIVDVSHRLEVNEFSGSQRLRRPCVVCHKRGFYYCFACRISVCIGACFVKYHS